MRKNNCELIRRELDELMLDETCSTEALEHLRECGACREFHEKQTKLRQIVGSLGTVAAPADFDFRLRARLANESSSGTSPFSFVANLMLGPVLRRGFAAVAVLVVFAIGAYMVRTALNRPATTTAGEMAKQSPVPAPNEAAKPLQETVNPTSELPKSPDVTTVQNKRLQGNRIERAGLVAGRNKPLATKEISSTGATVIGNAEPVGTSTPFSIDASSLQYFRVSVDDGRGNAKTIFVPTISFGSQRLMQNANQFAPKRVW
jgi:hypothetical protein